jgi:outer membrane protein OmpA-like peptidoglycan-associated protein/uncharacterized protein YidB (DUF937 family)
MGTFDPVLAEAGTQFGLNNTKTTSLLSGLISIINETPGGLADFLDHLRRVGLTDFVSTWLGDAHPRPISRTTLEATFGRDPIDKIATKAGVSYSKASSAIAFMLPAIIQHLTPGGVVPTELPSDVLTYAGSATSVVAAGAHHAAYATDSTVRKAGAPAWYGAVLVLPAIFLLGYWFWNMREPAKNSGFNMAEQIRLATQKASSALAALRPGFSANDLVAALNLNEINFASGSAQIPLDAGDYLNSVALALKAAPSGTSLEIGGHTDNSGDAASNLALSQQRADSVRIYLIQHGVDPLLLVAKGYGDAAPLGSNDTEEGKFRNRRIEFTLR